MSIQKTVLNKKVAAGAALVALSGFVPQPLMQQAHAASAGINVSGSFITGVSLAPGVAADFGKLVGTAATGNVTLKTGGTIVTPVVGAKQVGATSTNGTFKATIVNKTAKMDVTVAGMGKVTLTPTVNGAATQGTVTLSKVILGGPALTGAVTITNVAGTGKTQAQATVTAASTINVGGRIEWTGAIPRGQFQQAITLTMAF